MTSMNDRERAFEAQFARDAELQFRVAARRDKLVGLWAAARLGHAGDAAEAYARAVVAADLVEAGDDDVIGKLLADLGPLGVTEHEVRGKLAELGAEARAQIMTAIG